MITIEPESPADRHAVRELLREAFGQPEEAALVDALREAGEVALELVAKSDGLVVGDVVFSRVAIPSAEGDVAGAILAPVAILPAYQRQGIGAGLIEAGLERLRASGGRFVVVLGEPAYYGRFGFTTAVAEAIPSNWSGPYWQAIVWTTLPEASGRLRYPAAFDALS